MTWHSVSLPRPSSVMLDAGKYDEMGSKSAGHGGGGDREGGGVDANIAMLEKEHEEITKVHTGNALYVAG